MKLFILLITACSLVVGCSGNSAPAEKPSEAFIQATEAIVQNLIQKSFPELAETNISVKGIDSDSVFLATDIVIPSLFKAERQYILYLNQHLEKQPMTGIALEGILAHELSHFVDYTKMSIVELAIFYAQILTNENYAARYERGTDLNSFERGYADGVKQFRLWLYQQISPEAKLIKERNYFTPNEIDRWIQEEN
jgi:hypothetical protein